MARKKYFSGPFEVIMCARTFLLNACYQNEWIVIPYDDDDDYYCYDSVNFYLLLLHRIKLDKWANIHIHTHTHTHMQRKNQQNRIFIQMCNEKWQTISSGERMFLVVVNRWHCGIEKLVCELAMVWACVAKAFFWKVCVRSECPFQNSNYNKWKWCDVQCT